MSQTASQSENEPLHSLQAVGVPGKRPLLRTAIPTIGLLFFGVLSGCAKLTDGSWISRETFFGTWSNSDDDDESQVLQPLRKSADSITVDVVVVRFPPQLEEELQAVWESIDENVLPPEHRMLLARNGLRVGIITGNLPSMISERLSEKPSREESVLQQTGLSSDVDTLARRMQCRAGRRKEVQVRRECREPISILTCLGDQRVSGTTFDRANALFDLRVMPQGDASALIRLTPEVQYGEIRQSFVSSDYGIRPEMKRSQKIWKELSFEVALREGGVLAVAATNPPRSLGAAMFVAEAADRSRDKTMLLIRLTDSRLDELFAPELVEQARILTEQ